MVFKKVKEFISQQLSIDENNITMNSDLKKDLGIDSIDAVGFIIKIEDFFKISISDEVLQKFVTVQDIVEYIKNLPNTI